VRAMFGGVGGAGGDGTNPFGRPTSTSTPSGANPFAASANGGGDGNGNLFGTTPFGRPPPPSASPFGQPSTSVSASPFGQSSTPSQFGQAPSSTPFGSTSFGGGNAGAVAGSSPFVGASGVGTSSSPFGQASGGSPFGQSGGGFGAASPFGQSGGNAVSGSPFGQPSSAAATSSPIEQPSGGTAMSGQGAAASSPFGQTSGAFGSTSASPFGAGSSSPFGAASAATPTPFGTTTVAPTGASPFGSGGTVAASPFGSANTQSAPTDSPFGSKPQTGVAASPFLVKPAGQEVQTSGGGGFSFGASVTSTQPGFSSAFGAPSASPSPFGAAPAFGALSANASPFKPKTSADDSMGASPAFTSLEDEKQRAPTSTTAFAASRPFVPPKPRLTPQGSHLASERPSTSAVAIGGQMGEIPKGHIVGTCDLMCPEKEKEFRSVNGDLEIFERISADDRTKSNSDLCIKKYTRIVDEITPDMVRTKKGLQLAIDQLWRILDGRDEDFMTKSKFLWDRLRSIRQDLNLQQITDSFAVNLLEQMARYTILAEHELCEETASATNPDGHNSHLNVEQLTKTLTSLRHMYDDHADRGQQLSVNSEAEMYCYQLLLRIDSHGRYAVQRSEMLNDLRGVRPEVLKHRDVQFALECHRAYHGNNVAGFFRLVNKATYLQACCLHKFFNSMRGKALEVMNSTYGKFVMPITEIARLLHTDDIETEALCIHHGLNVSRGKDGDKPPAVIMRESSYISPAEEFPISRSDLVINKRADSYLIEIVGKENCARILAKEMPQMAPKTTLQSQAPPSESDKLKKQADELRAKIAAREAALAAERATILAKKKEIEERKAAEKKAAEEAEAKAKAAEEEAKRREAEAKIAEEKARAEAEAAEAERRRLEEVAAREKAEAEARALAEAERRRAEEEAERQRLAAEQRAREAAEAARLAAIAKAEAEERARQAAAAEAERLRLIAEENARRQAAAAKAARKTKKMHMAVCQLTFSRWRMNFKEFKRERLIGEALSMASPSPALNLGRGALMDARIASARPTDVLARLRAKVESSRSPAFGQPLDMPQVVGTALHDAAAMAAPSALVWKCLLCTGAEADSGPSASARPRTAAASLVAEWLRLKLSRGSTSHEVPSNTGTILSLYGARLPLPGASDDVDFMIGPLAWIIVRDVPAMMDNAHKANTGASAGIFVLDCGGGKCDAHEMKRLREFNAVVRANDAPLVVLVASRGDGVDRSNVEKQIESAGIEDSLLIFLPPEDPAKWQDDKLADVLAWLAERAPKAPRRRIAHLSAEIEEALRPGYVDLTTKARVSARACIYAFNHALDQVEAKISEAAQVEEGGEWPPIEIGLVNAALPPPGWRSAPRRAKVINALRSVRLPEFKPGDESARAFIDYVAKVLPDYPDEYGRCMLSQARYDPHFHKLDNIPWIALFQSLITLLLSGLESRTRNECIYLPPGHPSYDFTPYEPEPELLTRAGAPPPATPREAPENRKRKHTDDVEDDSENARFDELGSEPLDDERVALDALNQRIGAQTRHLDASERWLAALATNTPGTAHAPDAFLGDVDVHLSEFHAQLAAERAAEARLRSLLNG
jgi:hypothetical protein